MDNAVRERGDILIAMSGVIRSRIAETVAKVEHTGATKEQAYLSTCKMVVGTTCQVLVVQGCPKEALLDVLTSVAVELVDKMYEGKGPA